MTQTPRNLPLPGWYSALLVFATTIDGSIDGGDFSIRVFTADDFTHAKQRARQLALQAEEQYTNRDGQTVQHRLARIETLDYLGTSIDDGREIYHHRLTTAAVTSHPNNANKVMFTEPDEIDSDAYDTGQSGV